MNLRILGPLEIERDGETVSLGPKQQTLLAILLVNHGSPVSADRIVDDLYAGRPPRNAFKTLQVHVSRLRKALGNGEVETAGGGYRLVLGTEDLDVDQFDRLADAGRLELAAGESESASRLLGEALALWRGPALADFAYAEFAQAEIARLEERRLGVLEDRIDADLALGRHAALTSELEALARGHPLRERLRAQLMLALYRSGRQAESLEAYQQARHALVEDLGIEPSRSLRELQQAILEQDPALELESGPTPIDEVRMVPRTQATPLANVRTTRKTVTALHVRTAITSIDGGHVDAEVLRGVNSLTFGVITAAIEAHEGSIDAVTGDSVGGVFGLPLVHEDDPQRAVRAADEIRARFAQVSERLVGEGRVMLELRIGVSTGEVLTRDPAVPHGRAAGEPLTTSVRLAGEAGPGEIALDETTRRAVLSAERGESRFASPMVGRERERRRLHDAVEQALSDGSCQLFTILGAAGVGKSRLVQEFLADLGDEALVARGRCLPYGEGITFWPILEAVRDVADLDDAESPVESRSRIVSLLASDDEPAVLAQHVLEAIGLEDTTAAVDEAFTAVMRFFEVLGRGRTLVVVFDDIHWGESIFLDCVEHIADWSRGAPMLLVCMARPELIDSRPQWGGGKLNATSVLLEPLSANECKQLVANVVGETELAQGLEARIAEAAEGNPLFVEEMLSMMIDDGLLVHENGRWAAAGDLETVPVPRTIRALLAARLDRLHDDERGAIERAAVEGKLFHRGSVEQLSPDGSRSSVREHLGSLLRKELIRPDRPLFAAEDAYRFRHLLIRDAAYESIPKEVRAELHERHVDWLEAKTDAVEYEEIVGYHLEQAFRYRAELGSLDDGARTLGRRAAERLGAAGRRALLRSDAPAGVNLISRAAALLAPDDPLRVELVPNIRVVQGLRDLGWADRVLTEAVEAAATTGDRRLAAHALVQRGLLRLFSAPDVTPQELLQAAEQAIRVFEDVGDELGLTRAWRLISQAHYLARRCEASTAASEQALLHARRAADKFEEREIVEWLIITWLLGPAPAERTIERLQLLLDETAGQHNLEAQIRAALAPLLAMQGRLDEAEDMIESSKTIMESLGEYIHIVHFWWGFVFLWTGDPTTAELELQGPYEALKKVQEKSHFSSLSHAYAAVAYALGRYEDAERLTRECEEASRANDVHSQILWRAIRAKVYARRGRFDEAERLARESVALAESSDFLIAHADALADLAEVLELAGRIDEVARELEDAIKQYELKGNSLAAATCRDRLDALR